MIIARDSRGVNLFFVTEGRNRRPASTSTPTMFERALIILSFSELVGLFYILLHLRHKLVDTG